MNLDSILIAYWSLRDPLCQSQVLPVLRGLARDGYRLGLMTFEQEPWRLPPGESRVLQAGLSRQGIHWLPRRYHAWPPTLSTIVDVLTGAVRLRRERARLLHGRGSVPAAIAYLASRKGALFLNDADGPLSQEYVDAGIWRPGSFVARLVARAERVFLETSDANAVLTTIRASEIRRHGRMEPVVLPCAVETEHFRPVEDGRLRIRDELALGGTVFAYAGKMGGWYQVGPMMDFVAAYQGLGEKCTLLVLTSMAAEPFQAMAAARGIPCRVRFAPRDQMPAYLSAADVGLSFIMSAPSKRACSPVKNGEYLACGLPLVTTSSVGDYSDLVASHRVGVVVESLEAHVLERRAAELRELRKEGEPLRRRCRQAACNHAGLNEVVLPTYRALYRALLGAPGAPA